MNELFDKLILRMVFTLFICLILFLYKYAHSFLYPSSRHQMFKRFFPSKNSPDTLHLFSRIIGITIIFSEFYFDIGDGILPALLKFFITASVISSFYLLSIYIVESIVLYNFEYQDEILKRRNYSYALISFSHSLGVAYILKTIVAVTDNSLVMIFFLWLLSMVLIGFATKTFSILSKLSFNKLLVQKNLAVGLSYMGFLLGWTLIISSSLNHTLSEVRWYSVQVILKILLSLIIAPIFKFGIKWIFQLKDDYDSLTPEGKKENPQAEIGYGVYEGVTFFTSCFLTTVITGNIHFENFYPSF